MLCESGGNVLLPLRSLPAVSGRSRFQAKIRLGYRDECTIASLAVVDGFCCCYLFQPSDCDVGVAQEIPARIYYSAAFG